MYRWDDKYSIGVPSVDEDHRKLFKILNRVAEVEEYRDSDRSVRMVREGVKYLKNYVIQHFENEEAYQKSIDYEYYEKHKKEHEDFGATVLEYEKYLEEENYSREAVEKFLAIGGEWLVEHIMISDMDIGRAKRKQKA